MLIEFNFPYFEMGMRSCTRVVAFFSGRDIKLLSFDYFRIPLKIDDDLNKFADFSTGMMGKGIRGKNGIVRRHGSHAIASDSFPEWVTF